ncbi:hypothetical protein Asp14428_32720 [Actinoplanes sp. NBRC 14428]|nr:hypothetical protein Asp14428_32720 [Actinoplanes sp. NBRC 14428]
MTDTTTAPSAPAPEDPEPQLRDLVRVRAVLADHENHPGFVIDILRPSFPSGDRYRVRFRDGITDWYWRDELTVVPFTAQAEIVRTDLSAIRAIFDHALTAARDHDPLHHALGEVFDALTSTARTYLGGNLDTLTPTAAPTD